MSKGGGQEAKPGRDATTRQLPRSRGSAERSRQIKESKTVTENSQGWEDRKAQANKR